MSASLVGSEMCIRDSPLGEREARDLLIRCRLFLGAQVLVVNAKRHAVSYTHLTLPTICSV
eukprot:13000820-Alexandrium_andersonii.AAC.1